MQRHTATSTPFNRQVFFWSLAVSYFIITFTVIFLSLGYRIDLSQKQVVLIHTGSVNLKSTPRNVDVTIDGEKPSGRHLNIINSSYHVTGIGHGFHNLRISADGYRDWEKEIVIRSGVSTEFWNVIMLKEKYEKQVYNIQNPERLFFAPKNDLVIYPQKKKSLAALLLPIVNVSENNIENIIRIPDASYLNRQYENIEWSPDTTNIVIPITRTKEVAQDNALSDQEDNQEVSELTQGDLDVENLTLAEKVQQNLDEATSTDETLPEDSPITLDSPQEDYVIAHRGENGHTITYLSVLINDYLAREARILSDNDANNTSNPSITLQENVNVLDDPVIERDLAKNHIISSLRWHPSKNNILYVLIDSDLVTFNIKDTDAETAHTIAKNVLAYDFTDDGVYILFADGTLQYDNSYDADSLGSLTSMDLNKEHKEHRLIAYDKNRVLYIDDNDGSLILYNKNDDDILTQKISNGEIIDARFSNDGKKLLYHTENRAFVFFTREWPAQPQRFENETKTVLEADKKLLGVEWLPDYEHFIAIYDDHLDLVELDHREGHKVETFLSRNLADTNLTLNQADNTLYFTDAVGNTLTQLFSIEFPFEKQGLLPL